MKGILKTIMDNLDLKDACKILCGNEEITQTNNSSLMLYSSKITELEQANAIHNVKIVNLLLLQKQQIDSLEVECNSLHSLVLS